MLETVVTSIEESALDPGAWLTLQRDLERFFGCGCSQLARCEHNNGNKFWSRTTEIPEFDDELVDLGPVCEPALWCAQHPNWQVFSDYDYIDEASMDRSYFYNQNARFGFRYRLGIKLLDTPGVTEALVLTWPSNAGHVQRAEYEKLSFLRGKLRFAARVADRVGKALRLERTLVDGLALLGEPALVLDTDGRILASNGAAEAMLADGPAIKSLNGILEPANRQARDALGEAIRAAARGVLSDDRADVVVPRPDPSWPLIITLVPLPSRHQLFGPSRRLVLALVRDGSRMPRAPISVVKTAFGLTEAEAEVAKLMAGSETISAIAQRRGTTIGTTRHQVKLVLSKLGVSRQSDVVRLLHAYFG